MHLTLKCGRNFLAHQEQEAKDINDIAYKHAIEEKKHQQALKKAQMETEKLERAEKRAVAKEKNKTNTEMA